MVEIAGALLFIAGCVVIMFMIWRGARGETLHKDHDYCGGCGSYMISSSRPSDGHTRFFWECSRRWDRTEDFRAHDSILVKEEKATAMFSRKTGRKI